MSKAVEGAALLAGAALLLVPGVGWAADAYLGSMLFQSLVIGMATTGLSMEAGAIADALTQNRGMNITTRQPAAYRQIIYGQQRVGGVMVYESTTGSHLDQYNMIIVLATHEIDSIVNLYLDGRQVYWTTGSSGNVTRNGVNFGGLSKDQTYTGPGGAQYNFKHNVYCEARFGDQADGDVIAGMTANDPNWTASASGAPYLGGCAYVYLKIQYDSGMFPQFPEIRFTVNGKNNIVDPRISPGTGTSSFSPVSGVLARPTGIENGWGASAQQAMYEGGVDQGYNWGYNSSATIGYSDPFAAIDSSGFQQNAAGQWTKGTSANVVLRHTHQYAGVIWSFTAPGGWTTPSSLYLNILSMVDPAGFTGRSAGIWYSLNGGAGWTQIYDTVDHPEAWDSILLSPTQDLNQIQVMAFTDSHDDMAHYVYDINLHTSSAAATSAPSNEVYTSNWALIVSDVLTDNQWGLGDIGAVNQAQLIAAANVCDEQVTLGSGSTEYQWSLHWHYDTSSGPGDVLQSMMSAAAGRLSRIGGEWYVWPAYWQGPSFTVDQTYLTGTPKWKPYRKQRELFNRVTGTYIAPNFPYNVAGNMYDANGWYNGTSTQNNFPFAFQPTNYPMYACDPLHGYTQDQYLAQDGGIQLPKEIVQSCVLSVAQAQRAAKVLLLRNRQQGSGTLMMNLTAWAMQPMDVMLMTFPQQGWNNTMLEVTGTNFIVDDQGGDKAPRIMFQVDVQQTDPSVYEWSVREELTVYDVPANPNVGSPSVVPPPTSVSVASNQTTVVVASDGVLTPQLLVSWLPPADPTITRFDVQFQVNGAASWSNAPSVGGDQSYDIISGVVQGTAYNVQVRSVRANGAASVWAGASTTSVSLASRNNVYQINPATVLTNGGISGSNTQINMAACSAAFNNLTVNYGARSFLVSTPSTNGWYYVTIADPTQIGDASGTLTATCQSSDALVGVPGNTFIGAVQIDNAGNVLSQIGGGWPNPKVFQYTGPNSGYPGFSRRVSVWSTLTLPPPGKILK
jgi:hypothetical protein